MEIISAINRGLLSVSPVCMKFYNNKCHTVQIQIKTAPLVQFNLGLHGVLRHSNKYLGSITLSKICKYIKVSLGE